MKGVTGVILAAIFVLVVAIGAAVYVAYGESFTGLFWQDSSPEAGGAVGEGAPGSGTPNGGDAAPFTGRLVEKDNGESSDDGSGAEPEAPPQDSQADDQG